MQNLRSGSIAADEMVSFPLVLAHGGAGAEDPSGEKRRDAIESISRSLMTLSVGLSLDQILLKLVGEMEEDSQFNSGRGACLQADGQARVSASFMNSSEQKFSAVINAEGVLHPSLLAYALQSRANSVLDGRGARDLAIELQIPQENLVTPQRFERWLAHKRSRVAGRTGTVGVVAASAQGQLGAVTSTGGVGHESSGRVGDTPTIAGNYCSKDVAVSCTGVGEQIVASAVAPRLSALVESGMTLARAAEQILKMAEPRNHSFAFIAVHSDSSTNSVHWTAAEVNATMVWAMRQGGQTFNPLTDRKLGQQCI